MDSQELERRIKIFNGLRGWVSNFTLLGPIGAPGIYRDYVALFKRPAGDYIFTIIDSCIPARSPGYFYGRILSLEIPERIRNLGMVPDSLRRSTTEASLIVRGLPMITVMFGETPDTRDECVLFTCVAGRTPQSALDLIQQAVRDRQSQRN